jgi:GR25 family glycosyltransferase involved in LPS biosynthesis
MPLEDFRQLIQNHFYINLDRRTDRRDNCIKELLKWDIIPNRFSAIHNKVGIIGCGMSHLKCLQIAKEKRYPYVAIFEDDIVIPKPRQVENIVNRIIKSGVEWDVILLAGNNFKPNKVEKEDYYMVNKCFTTTAYIVREPFYDKMIENLKEGLIFLMETGDRQFSLDSWWCHLQRENRFLLINPLSIYQRADYSDIENCNVDYISLMLNDNK